MNTTRCPACTKTVTNEAEALGLSGTVRSTYVWRALVSMRRHRHTRLVRG